jgi:hypothetical protein
LSFKFRERDRNSFFRKTCDASFVILLVAGENTFRVVGAWSKPELTLSGRIFSSEGTLWKVGASPKFTSGVFALSRDTQDEVSATISTSRFYLLHLDVISGPKRLSLSAANQIGDLISCHQVDRLIFSKGLCLLSE